MRLGATTNLALGGGSVYYGTVDATPLFVVVLGELARWGGLPDDADDLIGAADRALEWILRYGDRDGDGFVEYARLNEHGLVNQGWKDSWDGITFADGSLARAPIALCEVQGYVYAAFLARAAIASFRGDDELAAEWEERAANLKREFNDRFWLPERGYFALALDADKRPVDSCASNMGHCLWTGIVDDDKAAPVAGRLLSDQLFTGWGVRTLASDMGAYNPASYHNGSVWPHDNAIVAAGLMRYGFVEEANRIVSGMFEAASAVRRPASRAVLRIRSRAVSRAGLVSGVLLAAGLGRRDAASPCSAPPSASSRRCRPATSGSRPRRRRPSATSTCAMCRSRVPGSPWTPYARAPRSSAFRPASPCTRRHALHRLRCPFEGTRHENRHHRPAVDPHPADGVRRHRVVHRHARARAARCGAGRGARGIRRQHLARAETRGASSPRIPRRWG